MTASLSLEPIVAPRSGDTGTHGVFVLVGPEPSAPIDGRMVVIDTADDAEDLRSLVIELLNETDADRVFIAYLVMMRGGMSGALPATLGDLLHNKHVADLHLVAVSQRVRHRISGLEAAAALFGVFGSDYLILGAHFLGLSPSALVEALERDEIPAAVQKLIAAAVANARPFAENGLIEAVERVDLMLPPNGSTQPGRRIFPPSSRSY